jgi:hypothetical protein
MRVVDTRSTLEVAPRRSIAETAQDAKWRDARHPVYPPQSPWSVFGLEVGSGMLRGGGGGVVWDSSLLMALRTLVEPGDAGVSREAFAWLTRGKQAAL